VNLFPTLPFKIDQDSDGALVKYLKATENFPFLKEQTRNIIAQLNEDGLLIQNKLLLQLWPQVLVDALWELKKHDPREWTNEDQGLDYGSFFHEGSLGVTELRDVLESFARFESMLYGASPDRYRDHIAHAFRVWIVGQAILSNSKGFQGNLFADNLFENETGSTSTKSGISKIEWQCMWAIVALCHDLGYPLSHVDRINSLARDALRKMGLVPGGDLRFSFSQQMLPFHDTLIRLMASKPIRIDNKFRFDTLAFLLYVVDEIQCWGRPTLEELQHQAMGMPGAAAQVTSFENDKVAVVIRTKMGKWSDEQQKGTLIQLSKLHRMLRLGVDTAMLKNRYLEFAVVPENGEGNHLLLKNGKISIGAVADMQFDHLME
jgi:hypothetical protein